MKTSSAVTAAFALPFSLALSACFLSEERNAARPLSAESEYIGRYTVAGNRIIMVTEGDTLSYCHGSERRELARPSETDTLEFHLDRDRITVYNAPEAAGPAPGPGPVVRISWEAGRVGPGSGLEGHWRIRKFDHHLVSGSLGDSLKTAWEDRMRAWRRGNALGISELELREGRAYARSDIRWADLFVAEWNGELETDRPADSADRARYDIAAKALDKYTVELKGRRNGETVRIEYSKKGHRTYSSDAAGRLPYQEAGEPATCPDDPDRQWYGAFKAANAKASVGP